MGGVGSFLSKSDQVNIHKEATKEVLREKLLDENHDESDLEELEHENDDVEVLLKNVEKEAEFDVFVDYVAPLLARGEHVKILVFKDGTQVGTLEAPYDWENVQKCYCEASGGAFKVEVRNRKGHWIKQQTRFLARLGSDELNAKKQKAEQDSSTNQIINILAEQRKADVERFEREKRELMEELKESKQSVQSVLLAQMSKPRDDSQNTMMLEFIKLSQANTEKLQQQIREDRERADRTAKEDRERIERQAKEDRDRLEKQLAEDRKASDKRMEQILTTLATKKDDGISAIAHMEKLEKARKEAKEEARKELEMIEKRANIIAEEKIEAMASSDGEEKEESALDKVVKMIPAFLGARGTPTVAAPVNPPRAVAPPARPPQARPAPRPAQVAANPRPIEKVAEPVIIEGAELKEKIISVASPVLLAGLIDRKKSRDCATEVFKELHLHGLAHKNIGLIVTANDLIELCEKGQIFIFANSSGIERSRVESWLKDFHYDLGQKSSKGIEQLGEPSPAIEAGSTTG